MKLSLEKRFLIFLLMLTIQPLVSHYIGSDFGRLLKSVICACGVFYSSVTLEEVKKDMRRIAFVFIMCLPFITELIKWLGVWN